MTETDAVLAEQIRYYRDRAPEYDATSSPDDDPFAAAAARIEAALDRFAPSGNVLEIACGTGGWTERLARHGCRITALDAAPEMIELADDRLRGRPVNVAAEFPVKFVVADVMDWTPEERYDVVFFANWLSHVPDRRLGDFWNVVARALEPDGRVFFVDEAEDAWRKERSDPAPAGTRPEIVRRTLLDGRSYRVVKVFRGADELEARLRSLGWDVSVTAEGPFLWGAGRLAR